jgi:hypothetical protein
MSRAETCARRQPVFVFGDLGQIGLSKRFGLFGAVLIGSFHFRCPGAEDGQIGFQQIEALPLLVNPVLIPWRSFCRSA